MALAVGTGIGRLHLLRAIKRNYVGRHVVRLERPAQAVVGVRQAR